MLYNSIDAFGNKIAFYAYLALFSVFILSTVAPAYAQDTAPACSIDDRTCVLRQIESEAAKIENPKWRDQTLRELAKTLTLDGDTDAAIALIERIETPDTRAMTIRGIGMAAAENELNAEEYDALFTTLRTKADAIAHPPSYAIALTYIAMAQAFADDDEGAWKTASDMSNDALRHKAFAETAEIQAEHGKVEEAMKSITYIESEAFRNKAYTLIAKILAEDGDPEGAYKAAQEITNAYKKTQTLQFILNQDYSIKE